MASANTAPVGGKVLRLQRGQGLVGEADVVEGAVDGEGGDVVFQGEGVRHVGGVEDEVEGEGPWFGPVGVGGGDKFFGAEGEGVGLLRRAVGDGVGFGAEGAGPQEAEVAEAAAWEGG